MKESQDQKLPTSWSSQFQDAAGLASGDGDPLAPQPPKQQQPPPPPRSSSSSEVEELRNQLQALQRERAEDHHSLIKDLESRLEHHERPPPFAPGTGAAEAPPATTTVGEQQEEEQQQVHHHQIGSTRIDPEAQQEQEQQEVEVDEDNSSSSNNKRQGGSSSSSNITRPRQHRHRVALAAVGVLVLVVVAVIVAVVTGGNTSSGGSSSTTTTSWKQLGADLNGVAAGADFGYSIALSADGTIMAVGAPRNNANGFWGQVRVFAYDKTPSGGGRWKQLGADLNGAAADDWFGRSRFGRSVALSADGTILAVGAPGSNANGIRSGHVCVFSYSKENNQWKQLGADLNGVADYDFFGYSVALSSDGTILAVGAHGNDGNGKYSGQVRVFQYGKAEGRWIQLGADLNGEAAGDEFGTSVALSEDGTILAAGGQYNDGNGAASGHARVFRYNAASPHWYQLGADLDGKAAGDWFGRSVALSRSGFILAVGGPGNDANGNNSAGHVRVFEYSTASNKWKQIGGDLDGKAADDEFGGSVALSSDGTVLVVGAPDNDDNGSNSGHARIFQYDKANEQWNQLGEDLNGKAAEDRFGFSVALSAGGTIVAGGARENDDNGKDSGQVQVFQRDHKSGDP